MQNAEPMVPGLPHTRCTPTPSHSPSHACSDRSGLRWRMKNTPSGRYWAVLLEHSACTHLLSQLFPPHTLGIDFFPYSALPPRHTSYTGLDLVYASLCPRMGSRRHEHLRCQLDKPRRLCGLDPAGFHPGILCIPRRLACTCRTARDRSLYLHMSSKLFQTLKSVQCCRPHTPCGRSTAAFPHYTGHIHPHCRPCQMHRPDMLCARYLALCHLHTERRRHRCQPIPMSMLHMYPTSCKIQMSTVIVGCTRDRLCE